MNDRNQIDPELRRAARKMPFNRALVRLANPCLAVALRLTRAPDGVSHRRVTIGGYRGLPLRVDIFEPSGAAGMLPGLIDAHGGAFSYKASAHHKRLACLYALRAGCRVFFPDYHLAPRYPYPAAYEDMLAVYRHVTAHARACGVDPARVGVAGDSAGACLAALLCSRYEREGLRRPCLQMLVYPVTDGTAQTDSMRRFTDTPLWNAENNRRMWAIYCRCARDVRDASPMRDALPHDLPDTYIETAEYDCLRDEGALYAQKLRQAGARVELNETRGTFHGYDVALHTAIAARHIERRVAFLREGFGL